MAMTESPTTDLLGEVAAPIDRGWCLCLSGGGFRATLFHLGAIQRLNELGVLSQLSTITSVSGGSILNGLLASRWSQLNLGSTGIFENLQQLIVEPMREFCAKDLRTKLLLGTRLNPINWPTLIRDRFSVSANFLADAYEPLFHVRLGELPAPGLNAPRFIFCATNVSTGACWHFHSGPRARMGDFYTGYCDAGYLRVSDAVAASSAFPPGFSDLRLHISDALCFTREDPWGEQRVTSAKRTSNDRVRRCIFLTDAGVYDNLAVEPVWRTYNSMLVSDAGRPFESIDNVGQGIIARLRRATDISMEQVAAVRKRWFIEQLTSKRGRGALWAMHSILGDFPINDKRGYGRDACMSVQRVRTDLDAFSAPEIACLENHGYSLADAALRSFAPGLCSSNRSAYSWPHESWIDEASVCDALRESAKRKFIRDTVRYLAHR
jgi:NTE family protein